MAQDRRSVSALAALLPAGAFSLSVSLAAADAAASTEVPPASKPGDVAEKLQSIRLSVSDAVQKYAEDKEPFVAVDPDQRLAWWGNGWRGGWRGGWGNGGWHNGGWGNGGWGNGWHNGGWGNGWHNW
jgi:rSAM-associated Gly-rich repeat protein